MQSSVSEKQISPYDLTINLIRHGPKASFDGALTEEGKNKAKGYFSGHVFLGRKLLSRRIVSSPVIRALETAEIFAECVGIIKSEIQVDNRLSEGNVLLFKNLLPPDDQPEWFKLWYLAQKSPKENILIANQVLNYFSDWLLEKIKEYDLASPVVIDSFTHGPVMAAIILKIEELTDLVILDKPNSTEDRYSFDRLFVGSSSAFGYMASLSFYYNHNFPNVINLTVKDREFELPLSVIKKLKTA